MKNTILIDRIIKFNALIPFNKGRFLMASFGMILNMSFAFLMIHLSFANNIHTSGLSFHFGTFLFAVMGLGCGIYCFIKAGQILHNKG